MTFKAEGGSTLFMIYLQAEEVRKRNFTAAFGI
jgi:hypothetical protein